MDQSSKAFRGCATGLAMSALGACTAAGSDGATEPPAAIAETAASSCDALPVTGVTASGTDGHAPANVSDGQLGTRWSAFGKGQSVVMDMGAPQTISGLSIAWYKGDTRKNAFEISLSDDGVAFDPIFQGMSSGTKASPEDVAFADTEARYAKVTVNGNTENDWASISEIAVCGAGGSDPGAVDPFGVEMIYPTKPGGGTWFMDSTDLTGDDQVHVTGTVKHVSGDVWNGKDDTSHNPPTFRVGIGTVSGFSDSLSQSHAEHHGTMAQTGYMQDVHDWRNIEMTGYFKVKKVTDPGEEITMYARGGRHSDGTTKQQCQGTAYKASIEYAGGTKFAKEYHHDGGNGYVFPSVAPKFSVGSIVGKWIGMKTVMRNVEQSGKTVVVIQVYIDAQADQDWKLWYEITDTGAFAGKSFVTKNCGAKSASEILTWGGPVATFRIDEITSLDFKWLSIREITP